MPHRITNNTTNTPLTTKYNHTSQQLPNRQLVASEILFAR